MLQFVLPKNYKNMEKCINEDFFTNTIQNTYIYVLINSILQNIKLIKEDFNAAEDAFIMHDSELVYEFRLLFEELLKLKNSDNKMFEEVNKFIAVFINHSILEDKWVEKNCSSLYKFMENCIQRE